MTDFFFRMSIEDFSNYIDFMEENIEKHKKSAEDEFESQIKEMELSNPEDQQEFYENVFFDRYTDIDSTYTQILRKSLFFALYSFVETELRSTAIKLEKKEVTKIKLSDISHSGIRQYLFYIETVHDIDLHLSNDLRKHFIGYNILRNYFIHNDKSPINKKQYHGMNFIQGVSFNQSPIHKDEKYYVETISSKFNKTYLDKIQEFFGNLHQALYERELD
jgi:hypothetical protein